ncbi:MAG TPA: YqaJ viral recombinase family protein [Burkholderiaceae bacterium]|nr:YqaJ viral recombinase family protein [Burkholderiaceae bacterium]
MSHSLPTPTIVQLPQGSAEWLAYRRSRFNASESAAVLGVSPWQTPYQLWLQKAGRSEGGKASHAMLRGNELEPAARAAYEELTGLVMQPLVLEAGRYSASLDGMTLEGDLVLEIKCPLRGTRSDLWQDVAAGAVPDHYVVQVQHQLMVSGAAMAHLWVYDGHKGLLHEIHRDEVCMARIQAGWEAFAVHLDSDTPPALTEADTVQRLDAEWAQSAKAFAEAKAAADQASEQLEAARQALLALVRHPKECGAGVTVSRYWKAGNVDYKRVPALQGLDLTPWRGKGREEVRVTMA